MGKKLENVTIVFNDGRKELCDVMTVVENGVYTGHVDIIDHDRGYVVNHGFIPKDQINKIVICNEEGKTREINFKNNKGGKNEK